MKMKDNILFPDEKVIRTDLFDIHQDWEVPIPGFFIIAPVRKIRSVSEFSDEEASEFIMLLRYLRKGMENVLDIKDVYLFQNEDTSGSFHLWVFPRHDWMGRFGKKIQSVRPAIEYAKQNMRTEQVFIEVREYVKKMREFMSDFR